MATGDSVIRVSIIGDAKKLQKEIAKVDRSMGGLLKGAAAGFIAFQAVDKAFEAVGSVLENADRAGDAMGRLNSSIGEANTDKLADIAGSFSDIGVSKPDFLEIVAGFSEFAAASGKMDPAMVTSMAGGVAQFAGALGALKGVDPATLGDDIANFIAGTRGAAAAAKELGVPFDSALTPAQRYAQLMEKLPGLLEEITGANAGLDDKQNTLNAKWETFGSEVGPAVEEVLGGILTLFINIADDIPRTVKGFQDLIGVVVTFTQTVLGPLGNVRDVLEDIANGLSGASNNRFQVSPGRTPRSGRSESNTVNDTRDHNNRNGTVNNKIGGP